MIIEIDTYEKIEHGVCDALDLDKEHLREAVNEAYDDAYRGNVNFSGGTVFDNWISGFVQEKISHTLTEMYVCHLARLIREPDVLMPLPTVLTTNTTLSRFLIDRGISFRWDGNRLILSYNGQEISPTEIYNSDLVTNEHCALAKRLGYFSDEQDFCVNGFAFGAGVEDDLNNYFRSLSIGPEFLMCLDKFLKTSLRWEYKRESKYYKVYVKSPVDGIIFDGKDEIKTPEQKSEYFLEKCIGHLAEYYHTGKGMREIPIIRFADDVSVMVDHYEEIPE
ncbi:MAG: hypothetical protein LUD14_08565 [Clostridiales bacterium]|nr:hypothetical protein [Clostridiales bacterium]